MVTSAYKLEEQLELEELGILSVCVPEVKLRVAEYPVQEVAETVVLMTVVPSTATLICGQAELHCWARAVTVTEVPAALKLTEPDKLTPPPKLTAFPPEAVESVITL